MWWNCFRNQMYKWISVFCFYMKWYEGFKGFNQKSRFSCAYCNVCLMHNFTSALYEWFSHWLWARQPMLFPVTQIHPVMQKQMQEWAASSRFLNVSVSSWYRHSNVSVSSSSRSWDSNVSVLSLSRHHMSRLHRTLKFKLITKNLYSIEILGRLM